MFTSIRTMSGLVSGPFQWLRRLFRRAPPDQSWDQVPAVRTRLAGTLVNRQPQPFGYGWDQGCARLLALIHFSSLERVLPSVFTSVNAMYSYEHLSRRRWVKWQAARCKESVKRVIYEVFIWDEAADRVCCLVGCLR